MTAPKQHRQQFNTNAVGAAALYSGYRTLASRASMLDRKARRLTKDTLLGSCGSQTDPLSMVLGLIFGRRLVVELYLKRASHAWRRISEDWTFV
jgi:hypothetical protein